MIFHILNSINEMEVMFNNSTNINSPINLLERMQNGKDDFNTNFSISALDQFGNKSSGIFHSLDSTSTILTLIDEDNNITFFNVKYIAHLILHDSELHSNFIAGNLPEKKKKNESPINLNEKIDLLVEMLNKSYSLVFYFKFDESDDLNKLEKENISILLDSLVDNIKDLASDDFSMSLLKKVKGFHINDKKDIDFSMRMVENTIHINYNVNNQLPKNISNLIEKGFNKVL